MPATRKYYQFLGAASPPLLARGLDPLDPSIHYAIFEAVTEARENLAILFGQGSSEDRKTKIFIGYLEAVGWNFDLRYHAWSISPLRKKIEKIAHYLFNVVKEDSKDVDLHTMQILTGLLCWFSIALPIGKSFVYPLFRCRRNSLGRIFLSTAATRDLQFWRALIRVALVHPQILGCPIDLLRTDRQPDWFIVDDACTSIGGGSWISQTPEWSPGDSNNHWLISRWSPDELAVIEARLLCYREPTTDEWLDVAPSMDLFEIRNETESPRRLRAVTINVLEFTQAVYTLVVFAPILKNCVVDFGADNTATLCWLVRNRSSPGAADALLKLLSLTCTIYNIKLVVHHVAGIKNYLSDWMSRVLGAEFADPTYIFYGFDLRNSTSFLTLLHERMTTGSNPLDRRQVSRLLISHALLCPEDLTAETIILMMESLHHLNDIPRCYDTRIPTVLDAYQRRYSRSENPPVIPKELDNAYNTALAWNAAVTPPTP